MKIPKVLIFLIQEMFMRGNFVAGISYCPSYCSNYNNASCSYCTRDELCPNNMCNTSFASSFYYTRCIACGFLRDELCYDCWNTYNASDSLNCIRCETTKTKTHSYDTYYDNTWAILGPCVGVSVVCVILCLGWCWKCSCDAAKKNPTGRLEEERSSAASNSFCITTPTITSVELEMDSLLHYEELFPCGDASFGAPDYPPCYDDVHM